MASSFSHSLGHCDQVLQASNCVEKGSDAKGGKRPFQLLGAAPQDVHTVGRPRHGHCCGSILYGLGKPTRWSAGFLEVECELLLCGCWPGNRVFVSVVSGSGVLEVKSSASWGDCSTEASRLVLVAAALVAAALVAAALVAAALVAAGHGVLGAGSLGCSSSCCCHDVHLIRQRGFLSFGLQPVC